MPFPLKLLYLPVKPAAVHAVGAVLSVSPTSSGTSLVVPVQVATVTVTASESLLSGGESGLATVTVLTFVCALVKVFW